MPERQAFGAGNLLGLAALGIPLDVFRLNAEIPRVPVPASRPITERRDMSHDGLQIDISDVPESRGTIVSIWYNGVLKRSRRFEYHWWGKPRNYASNLVYKAWIEEFKDVRPKTQSFGGWRFLLNGW